MARRKNYSKGHVMDTVLNVSVNIGMSKALHKHTHNMSAYVRKLIMTDLKIDEYGKKI